MKSVILYVPIITGVTPGNSTRNSTRTGAAERTMEAQDGGAGALDHLGAWIVGGPGGPWGYVLMCPNKKVPLWVVDPLCLCMNTHTHTYMTCVYIYNIYLYIYITVTYVITRPIYLYPHDSWHLFDIPPFGNEAVHPAGGVRWLGRAATFGHRPVRTGQKVPLMGQKTLDMANHNPYFGGNYIWVWD